MTDIHLRRATQQALHGADNAWWNALVAQFGRKASEIRYTPAGAGEPGSALRRIYSDRFRAYEAWAVAHGMTAQPDPLVEPATAMVAQPVQQQQAKHVAGGAALTARQIEALQAARDKGGAIYVRGSRAGGAIRRMCERLAELGLVSDYPPFPLTQSGREALAALESRP